MVIDAIRALRCPECNKSSVGQGGRFLLVVVNSWSSASYWYLCHECGEETGICPCEIDDKAIRHEAWCLDAPGN
jgi:DNA-directed RNA polymerase subunit RPC12/RpoP